MTESRVRDTAQALLSTGCLEGLSRDSARRAHHRQSGPHWADTGRRENRGEGALGGADPAQTASLSQTRPIFKTGRPL
jgi:hypothetical protein